MQPVKKVTKKEIAQYFRDNKPNILFRRYFAFLVDFIVLYLIVTLPFKSFLESLYPSTNDIFKVYSFLTAELGNAKPLFYILIIISLLTLSYWVLLEYKTGQTLGKKLLNIKVVSKSNELTIWQCILRDITKINTLFLVFDVFYMWYYHTNQRYFEILSRTEVVEA